MKAKEVHKLKNEELDLEVARLKRRMFELAGQSVTEKIEDVSQFGKIRKDVARLLTEKNSRRESAPAAPKAPRASKSPAKPSAKAGSRTKSQKKVAS
jgi:large subunit ribosomal protein L29